MEQSGSNEFAQEIWRKDRDHFVHPWTHFDSFKKEGSLVMAEAGGVHIWDIDGKKYLDGIGGLWCMNVGYGREEIVEAMADQARKMVYANPFVDVTNIPAAELAAKLAEIAPGSLNHTMFSCGGSTANDTAFRLIGYYWHCRNQPQRVHYIARKESYHGSTYVAQSLTGKTADRQPEFTYINDTIHHISSPNPYRRPDGMSVEDFTDSLIQEFEDKIKELGTDKVAAFFAEPIMGAGGVIVAPEGYLQRMHEVCTKYGILFVADEVVTAFGRLGAWFSAKDVFGVQPDIITCAKGLTSGYQPLGATIFSKEIYDTISEEGHDRWFTNGFTYSGHPVACAAALKNIEIMEREDLFAHVRDVGPYFMERLSTLKDLPTVGEVRGMHLMVCIENIANKETKELLPDEVNIGKRIANAAEERGLIIRPVGHLNIMSPPLTITRAQCDEVVDILRESMLSVIEDLKSEGIELI